MKFEVILLLERRIPVNEEHKKLAGVDPNSIAARTTVSFKRTYSSNTLPQIGSRITLEERPSLVNHFLVFDILYTPNKGVLEPTVYAKWVYANPICTGYNLEILVWEKRLKSEEFAGVMEEAGYIFSKESSFIQEPLLIRNL